MDVSGLFLISLKSIEKTFNFDYNILNKEVGTIDEAYPFPANIVY